MKRREFMKSAAGGAVGAAAAAALPAAPLLEGKLGTWSGVRIYGQSDPLTTKLYSLKLSVNSMSSGMIEKFSDESTPEGQRLMQALTGKEDES